MIALLKAEPDSRTPPGRAEPPALDGRPEGRVHDRCRAEEKVKVKSVPVGNGVPEVRTGVH